MNTSSKFQENIKKLKKIQEVKDFRNTIQALPEHKRVEKNSQQNEKNNLSKQPESQKTLTFKTNFTKTNFGNRNNKLYSKLQYSPIFHDKIFDDYVKRVKSQQKVIENDVIINNCKKKLNQVQQKLSEYSLNGKLTFRKKPEKSKISKDITKREEQANQKKYCLQQTISTLANSITLQKQKKISKEMFKIVKMVGRGKFSQVHLVIQKGTGFIFALKILEKQLIRRQNFITQITRQIRNQSNFNHPNIAKIYAYFDDKKNVYMLMQYCPDQTLYDKIKISKYRNEEQFKPVLQGISSGLNEIHSKSVMHRDIKPQNILLSFEVPKITDFGWSISSKVSRTLCGTPLYFSPEIVKKAQYGKQVDIWPLGVMMFEVLAGRYPFKIMDEKSLQKIVSQDIIFPKNISPSAINLMKKMLQRDSKRRIKSEDLLNHSYLINLNQ